MENNKKYDVGILGWWYGQNYGSMLTYFALQKAVKNLGYKPVMVHEALGYNGYRVKWPDNIPPMEFARRQGYDYTEQVPFWENVKVNNLADTFMVGSDQLWNPHVGRVNDDLFLNFTAPEKKRIAYATSFGNADNGKYSNDFKKTHSHNLDRFDNISVRENYAVDTAKEVFGVDATQVVDPVFLIDKSEYEKLASEATIKPEGDYLMVFILDPTEAKMKVVKNVAKKLDLEKAIVITDASPKQIEKAKNIFHDDMFTVIEEIKPENYLYAYQNAKYVVTDSFHGSCFSYIFQKPFSVFYNTTRGADRFINLMSLFGLDESRRIYETNSEEDINDNDDITFDIDYSIGREQVTQEKEKSQEWLKSALAKEKDASKVSEGRILPLNMERMPKYMSMSVKDLLLQNQFAFYRLGQHGDILRQTVTFNPNGKLEGTNPHNENSWKLDGNRLVFLGHDGKETTAFENLRSEYTADEFRLVGEFLPNPRVKHVLEAIPTAVKKADENPDFVKAKILAAKLRDYGVKHIVLCPGGRDLSLVRVFENNTDTFEIHQVTDERSAGYFALGLANKLKETVAVVVTSGTASSNLTPAITEAFYMNLPVIAITADRYPEFHSQGEDQTIEQANMFEPMIRKSVNLPVTSGDRSEWYTRRLVSEAILEANHNGSGPVHINISFDAVPNLAPVQEAYKLPTLKHLRRVTSQDKLVEWDSYVDVLLKTNKILLVYGQSFKPTAEQQANIDKFAERYNVVILADWLSNLQGDKVVYSFNSLRNMNQAEFNKTLLPEVVISLGGKSVMNHPINFKLRGAPSSMRNWRVAPDGELKDLYYHLTAVLETTPDWFFDYFANKASGHTNNNKYLEAWHKADEKAKTPVHTQFSQRYATQKTLEAMPEKSLFHVGVGHTFMMVHTENTVPGKDFEVFLNMGTNGIDGSASSYMGQVAVDSDERLKFLMIGDMSFFYDMNSLWNKNLKGNIRIIMMNNSGSGLLDHYGSPATTQAHATTAEGWVKSLGFTYMSSTNKEEFDENLPKFVDKSIDQPIFFEVFI